MPQIPHLTTALQGPLLFLERRLLENQAEIEAWFRKKWSSKNPIVTSSVDLRNAGFKLAPVDTNLFPAGFNNLNPDFLPLCIQAAQATIPNMYPGCKKILLIAENHTRNAFYFQSLAVLQNILVKSGFDTRIGTFSEAVTSPTSMDIGGDKSVLVQPIQIKDGRVCIADFCPCLILLNNDFSEGYPDILQTTQQIVLPDPDLTWSTRLKTSHFEQYEKVAQEFSDIIDIDPWLIAPLFQSCGEVDFMTREGEACLMVKAEQLLSGIKEKYKQYEIDQQPFVVIKADSGTYGMGIMMIKDPSELENLNRKQRTKMSTTKGRQKLSKVIIQEGVHTFETWGADDAVTEPVVYMLGQYVIGGFYRVHAKRGKDENLNAPGMHFESLAFADACNIPEQHLSSDEGVNRFYAYGVIARLAALAAANEQEQLQHD